MNKRLVELKAILDGLEDGLLALDMTNTFRLNTPEKRVRHDLERETLKTRWNRTHAEYQALLKEEVFNEESHPGKPLRG